MLDKLTNIEKIAANVKATNVAKPAAEKPEKRTLANVKRVKEVPSPAVFLSNVSVVEDGAEYKQITFTQALKAREDGKEVYLRNQTETVQIYGMEKNSLTYVEDRFAGNKLSVNKLALPLDAAVSKDGKTLSVFLLEGEARTGEIKCIFVTK